MAHSLSPNIVAQQPSSSELFDLPLDQFSALSKPISQSQPLTWVSGSREEHWQYHWTQIICQCKHLDETDTAQPAYSQYKQQAERGERRRNTVPHQWAGIFPEDIDVIPSSAQVGYHRDSPCATMVRGCGHVNLNAEREWVFTACKLHTAERTFPRYLIFVPRERRRHNVCLKSCDLHVITQGDN